MRGYWSETRPNGKPVDPGQVLWIIDAEDGTHPVCVYGKDQQEVIDKLSRNNAHAQAALARRAQTPPAAPPSGRTPVVVPAKPRLSPDDVMLHTGNLDKPGKAGAAARALIEDETGIDFDRMVLNQFAATAQAWEEEHPEFYAHPGNKRLLADRAKVLAGGRLAAITPEILTQSYNELSAGGILMDAPAQQQPSPTPSTTLPGDRQGSVRERPRGALFATGARGTGFQQPASTQTRGPKYSAEEIRTMPEAKARALNEANDPDYIKSCEYHFGAAQTA